MKDTEPKPLAEELQDKYASMASLDLMPPSEEASKKDSEEIDDDDDEYI